MLKIIYLDTCSGPLTRDIIFILGAHIYSLIIAGPGENDTCEREDEDDDEKTGSKTKSDSTTSKSNSNTTTDSKGKTKSGSTKSRPALSAAKLLLLASKSEKEEEREERDRVRGANAGANSRNFFGNLQSLSSSDCQNGYYCKLTDRDSGVCSPLEDVGRYNCNQYTY